MSWIIRRLFNEKNVGYLVEIVKPKIKDEMQEMAKEAVIGLLQDEEVASFAASYADAIVDREKKRVFGAIGGMQKGINYATQQPEGGGGGLDIANLLQDGEFSLAKAAVWYMKNRNNLGVSGAIGGRSVPLSGKGAQNAPD